MSRLSIFRILPGTLLTIIAAPAAAQAAVPQRIDSSTILVVGEKEKTSLDVPNATGSRLNLTPLETPASITTIDGDTIRARGDQSIVEAQTRAPGITSVANLGNGGTALAARGFSGQGSVLQLIDGVRLFPAAGTITFPTDPWMVEKIDVLSGPASVLYGQCPHACGKLLPQPEQGPGHFPRRSNLATPSIGHRL